MPYSSVAELPSYVRKLAPKKQKQWMAAFNAAFKEYKGDEQKAFGTASAAIKEGFELPEEIGIELSEAMAGTQIRKDVGIIEGVLLLTADKVSKNKTQYTKKILQEAVTRYENAKMYLDHPAPGVKVRSVRDFGGTYKNVRIQEGNKLRADLHLVPNESIRSTVIPIAEAMPPGVGLSIRDHGHGREDNGVFLVEGFAGKGPFSIDLVMEASVNETLFESNQGGNDDMDLSKLTLAELTEANPALVEKIQNEAKAAALKEVEEGIKAGKDAGALLAKGKKLIALVESGLSKEVIEKVRPVVEQESTTLETTEALIKAQKEIVESLKPAKTPGTGMPKVKGQGGSTDAALSEGELPKDEELVTALEG